MNWNQFYHEKFYWPIYKNRLEASFNFLRYIFGARLGKKTKLLGIYDCRVKKFSVGATFEFNLQLFCLAHQKGIKKIDIAIICNPLQPVKGSKYTSWITKDNWWYFFSELLLLLNLNPKLDSVFLFKSRKELDRFLNQNLHHYFVFPPLFHYANELSERMGLYRFFRDFYRQYRFLPQLQIPKAINLWAKAFFQKYAAGRLPVAISLRLNPFHSIRRNSELVVWQTLFQYCLEKKFNVVFVVVGRKNELAQASRLRLPNVIFSSDYEINIQQELALIANALFYMGTASGIASLAFLSNRIPYVITNFLRGLKGDLIKYDWLKPGVKIPWQNPELQKLIFNKETPESLIEEFENLFLKIDKKKWQARAAIDPALESILNWPHLIK